MFQELPPDHPVALAAEEALADYTDHISLLTAEQRRLYIGKVLAIDCRTGAILASADNAPGLQQAVRALGKPDHDWRLTDGPVDDGPPMTVEELS